MNISRATAVFEDINSDEYPDEEKALAIYDVMKMPTHNGVKKDSMLSVIKWLWNKCYEIEDGEQNDTKRIQTEA